MNVEAFCDKYMANRNVLSTEKQILDFANEYAKERLILIHKELIPEHSKELEDFDMSKKDDHVYCVEWGMKKQRWIERGIHEAQIKKLQKL